MCSRGVASPTTIEEITADPFPRSSAEPDMMEAKREHYLQRMMTACEQSTKHWGQNG